jgi:hypothetical protein
MKHIQVDVFENKVECLHCGASYKSSFSKPIYECTQLMNAFTKDHKLCKKEEK